MVIPKRRKTSSKRDQRRMHIFLKKPALALCSRCGKPAFAHRVCQYCGYYKGIKVIDVLAKLDKKERKKREKELREKEEKEPKT